MVVAWLPASAVTSAPRGVIALGALQTLSGGDLAIADSDVQSRNVRGRHHLRRTNNEIEFSHVLTKTVAKD